MKGPIQHLDRNPRRVYSLFDMNNTHSDNASNYIRAACSRPTRSPILPDSY